MNTPVLWKPAPEPTPAHPVKVFRAWAHHGSVTWTLALPYPPETGEKIELHGGLYEIVSIKWRDGQRETYEPAFDITLKTCEPKVT